MRAAPLLTRADFEFAVPLAPRFSETDANHHVNDLSYFLYLSEARNAYFTHLGLFDYPWCRPGKPTHFSVHLSCDYRSQLVFGQRVDACARTERVGRTSIETTLALFEAETGRLVATGKSVCIHWDPAQGGAARITPGMRAAMERFEGREVSGGLAATGPAPPAMGRFPFKMTVGVRFAETDSNGHVNDISYFHYFSDARNRYFEALEGHGDKQARRNAYQFLTGHLGCNYLAQLSYGDMVECRARMARLGRSSAEMEFALVRKHDRALAATGRAVIVAWDRATGKTAPLRPAFRKAVAAYERRPEFGTPSRPASRARLPFGS